VANPTPFQRLGGEPGLSAIIDDFINRVTGDMMIGFFFREIDKEKLKALEYQFASSHLGGNAKYEGRPLRTAHAKHPIMGGQFNRRLKILDNTLRDHGVDEELRAEWLSHNEKLRGHITGDGPDECNPVSIPESHQKDPTGDSST
jgi:truncated hemoglobin YjbI